MKLPEVGCMNDEQRNSVIRKMKIGSPKAARQCEHIMVNGEFCGSPAMRERNYCYFHLTYIGRRLRAERSHAASVAKSNAAPVTTLELPPLEDANSIQMSLMQVIDAVLHNRLDNKRAGLVLYALQTASSNLANGVDFRLRNGATVAGGYDAFERDFELEEELTGLKSNAEEEDAEACSAVAQIEEQAAECAKLDAAEAEADAARTGTEDEEDVHTRGSYPCGYVSQLFCSIDGPLARVQSGGAVVVKRTEREAASQRLELLASLAPKPDEKAGAVAPEQPRAA
jgi:hypothetical protein